MKLAFDIGGVLSKYPDEFLVLAKTMHDAGHEVHIITDMHDMTEIKKHLLDNGFGWLETAKVHSADYAKYGEFCKAVLLKELGIDMFFDDFVGYVQWDSQLGEAPIRMLVAPNGFKPYWHPNWKCSGGDFGRRVCPWKIHEAEAIHPSEE